jgi:hypothetical protein
MGFEVNENIAQAGELIEKLVFDGMANAMSRFHGQRRVHLDVNVG